MSSTLKAINSMVQGTTYASIDGLLGSAAQAYMTEGTLGEQMQAFAMVEIPHQILHNMIDHPREQNVVKSFQDNTLGPYLPVDGLVGGAIAYFNGGLYPALAWGLIHGPLHFMITQ